ncbi:hypothetical protein ACWCPI_30240 [Streptomyces sp. NPDC001920]
MLLRDLSGRGHRAVAAALGCAPSAVTLTGCGDNQDTGPSPTPTTSSQPADVQLTPRLAKAQRY